MANTGNRQGSLNGQEACSGPLILGRALQRQGYDVRLIAALFVKLYMKSQERLRQYEAIAKAVERKNMYFIAIKTDGKTAFQLIHRLRHRLMSRRTAVTHQVRAFLLERGTRFCAEAGGLRVK